MDKVQSLLLDLISSVRPVVPDRFVQMSPGDWCELAALARDHRLEPALHYYRPIHAKAGKFPEELAQEWSQAFRNSAIRGLQIVRVTNDLKTIFGGISMPFFALKGAWLTKSVYTHPAIRPMRDLDILVPPERALSSYELLLRSGFHRLSGDNTPVEHAMKNHKHLPALVHSQTGILLELHTMLIHSENRKLAPARLTAANIFFRMRSTDTPNIEHSIFLDTEINLIHLVVHAFEDHLLDNGPVIILDVREVLKESKIDWLYFWSLAESGDWTNACYVIFDFVDRYHGPQPIDWPTVHRQPTPEDVLDATAQLCVQPFARRAENALKASIARSEAGGGIFALLARRLVPARHILASEGRMPPQSHWLWTAYPKWLLRRGVHYTLGAYRRRQEPNLQKTVITWITR